MKIRRANISDTELIARVHVDSWRTSYAGIVPDAYLASLSYEQRSKSWQDRLSDTDGWFLFVAEDNDGHVVGFAGGGPERGASHTFTGELGAIYLLKEYQRKGIGRQLVAAIVKQLIQQGHRSMLVWVLAANPARAFYEALGGALAGEKVANIGSTDLVEVAYGWTDLNQFVSGATAK